MSYILGLDGSKYQGNPDFGQVKAAGYEFWIQRMSYSYPGSGNKIDPTANANYYGAVNAGMIVGGYHKIGWTDPISEADFFVGAMSPLAENDLLAYDIEPASDVAIPSDWSNWEQQFVQHIFDRTGTWPLRYMNISMNNSMPAAGVVKNCASWVAAPSYSWTANVPVNVPVTIQQGPTVRVPGITANVCDTDAFFGDRDHLLKLAYHALQPTPTPQPTPPPAPDPTPAPVPLPTPTPEPTPVDPVPPTPTPDPLPTPEPTPQPQPTPTPSPEPSPQPLKPTNLWAQIIAFLVKIVAYFTKNVKPQMASTPEEPKPTAVVKSMPAPKTVRKIVVSEPELPAPSAPSTPPKLADELHDEITARLHR